MPAFRRLLVIGCSLLAAGPFAAGSQQPAPSDQQQPGSELTISVITWGQGDPLWEKFGHNALRVRDARTGSDVAYNWGTFDFRQPHFIQRFLTGNTLYWVDSVSTPLMLEYYRDRLDRTTVEQRLELTPVQRLAIREFVEWNVRPENRNYRYDYYLDNCSTRLRDAIDRVLGGALHQDLAKRPSDHTYRSESLRLVDALPFIQAGMHIALGQPADGRLTAWEESFVPMRLRDRLRAVRVVGRDGVSRPLVAEEQLLYQSRRAPEATHAPSLVGRFLIVGLLVAGLLLWLGGAARRGGRGARLGLAVTGVLWGLFAGMLGLVLTIAWTATRHVFWYRNENLLQLSPAALLLVALVPMAAYRDRWRPAAYAVAATLAVISVVGLVLKPTPLLEQHNLAVIALALPVHLALARALRPRAEG